MAKRASLSLGSLASQKPSAVPAPHQPEADGETVSTKTGRPRTLPDSFKTISVRVFPEVQKALRQAALNHDRSIQSIISDGIHDQLARLGVAVESE